MMIPIRSSKISSLLNEHVNSITAYINKPRTRYSESGINEKIRSVYPKESLESVLRASPEKIKDLITRYDDSISEYFKSYKNYYTSFAGGSHEKFSFNGYDLVNGLNIKVCPYCNRNFIYSTRKRRTAELDHYYPKDQYPLFALSFFNLIPVCHTCNHIKSNTDDKYPIHPYSKWFQTDSVQISYSLKSSNINDPKSVNLKFTSQKIGSQSTVDDHFDLLKLNDLYDGHKDIVCELLQKKQIYNESYILELMKKYGNLFSSRSELLRLITGNYVEEDDLLKRPLAKLNMDISKQIELI